jgi:DNA replication protein DnaC
MQLRIYDAKDIAQMSSDWDKFKTIRSVPVLAIEDMGREPAEVMSYGNITNPLVDLLEYRYAELLPTIITTNLTAKQIREKYGVRIADRFNEMIDVVIFQSGSYRK